MIAAACSFIILKLCLDFHTNACPIKLEQAFVSVT